MAQSAEPPVFGPESFRPSRARPDVSTRSIPHATPGQSLVLRVENRSAANLGHAWPAFLMRFNGAIVLESRQLADTVDALELAVECSVRNTLTVEFAPQAKGSLRVTGFDPEITPFVTCVQNLPGGGLRAIFGYRNPRAVPVRIPLAWYDNRFIPGPFDRGQPEIFVPGQSPATGAFAVESHGEPIAWNVDGDWAVATRSGRACRQAPATPEARDDSVSVSKGGSGSIPVLANDQDPQGDSLRILRVSSPGHGSARITGGAVLYTPAAGFAGRDSLRYTVWDGRFGSDQALIRIRVGDAPGNHPPLAILDAYVLDEDAPLNVPAPGVLANDTDADGDGLSAELVVAPTRGTATLLPSGELRYVPGADFNGRDSLAYRAGDGQAATVGLVRFTVRPVNDHPQATPDSFAIDASKVLQVPAPGVLANDSDREGTPLRALVATGPLYGSLQLDTNGAFRYAPAPGFSGEDRFTYQAHDGEAGSEAATVRILVHPAVGPAILGFSPPQAAVGAFIKVTGKGFKPDTSARPRVDLARQGGGTLEVVLQAYADTAFAFYIPPGTTSGRIRFQANGKSAESEDSLRIIPSSQFSLRSGPDTVKILPGAEAVYKLTLAADSTFTVLADLAVGDLPPGISALFRPAKLAAGNFADLKLKADSTATPGLYPLSVSAHAEVDGFSLDKTSQVLLEVLPKTTSFAGRTVVDDAAETPLAGVTVTLIGRDGRGTPTACHAQTVSDEAGNFLFRDLPDGCLGGQLIQYDGLTATAPPGQYAGVDLYYYLRKDTVIFSPILIHLPRIDDKERMLVHQNWPEDQHFRFQSIPNLSATVYAGTTLKMPDGSRPDPFPLIAVSVPLDRLPDEMGPKDSIMPFIVAFQPASTVASQPVSVEFPNLSHVAPGNRIALMTLDPTKGAMNMYGTGRPSADGKQLIPDFDPAFPGHRYGLVNFDWHGAMPPSPPPSTGCNGSACCGGGGAAGGAAGAGGPPPPMAGKPVMLASGIELYQSNDVSIRGGRGGMEIVRTYRTLWNEAGPFGVGSSHNYQFRLDTPVPNASPVLNLIYPNGDYLPFSRDADGVLRNSSSPGLRGAEMRTFSGNYTELRWKNGLVFGFTSSNNLVIGSILTAIRDANGNTTTLNRNSGLMTQLLEVVDPVGRSLRFQYDGANRIIAITDPIGRVARYTYNGQGTLETYTDFGGGVIRYGYDAANRMTEVTDQRGVVIARNTYGFQNRVSEQVQADGGRWLFRYYSMGRELGSRDHCVELGSAAASNVPMPGRAASSPCLPWTGPIHETRVTDPMGHETKYRFNSESMLIGTTDAEGQLRTYELEPGSNLVLAEHGLKGCSACGSMGPGDETYSYDEKGNMSSLSDSRGNTSTFVYDPFFSKLAMVKDASGNTSKIEYDDRGNPTSLTDAEGKITQYSFTTYGQLKEIQDPMGSRSSLEYDQMGNLSRIIDATGSSTYFLYDALSQVEEKVYPNGRSSKYKYDLLGRVESTVDGKGNTSKFIFDQVGNLLSVRDPKNTLNVFEYDFMNRQIRRITPSGKIESKKYDLVGNILESIDRRGVGTHYKYDTLSQLVEEIYGDGGIVRRQYDQFGRLVLVVDSDVGTYRFEYDNKGNLLSELESNGPAHYTYDPMNRVIKRWIPGIDTSNFSYGRSGELINTSLGKASIDIKYDGRYKPIQMKLGNGVSSEYKYDGAGRLLSISYSNIRGTIGAIDYGIGSDGLRSSLNTQFGTGLNVRPELNQFDSENRITESNGKKFEYDENGNLTSETSPIGKKKFIWDARNRLAQIVGVNGDSTRLKYDYSGYLSSIEGNGGRERRINDFYKNVAARFSDKWGHQGFLTGPQMDSHFGSVSDGEPGYPIKDGLGSTIAITNTTGEITEEYSYEPFGSNDQESTSYPFAYSGREPVVGDLLYYRARYYSPGIQRFISEDPILYAGNQNNFYQYVANNPIMFTDPSGLQALSQWGFSPCAIAGIVICGGITVPSIPLTGWGSWYVGMGCGIAFTTLCSDGFQNYIKNCYLNSRRSKFNVNQESACACIRG